MQKNISTSRSIKEFVQQFMVVLVLAATALLLFSPAATYGQSLEETLGTVAGGEKPVLPGFETGAHEQASYEFGAAGITSAIFMAVDLMKYLLGTIAVVVIIASGVRLITAGKQIEEIANQQKENIKYALIGLVVIILADTMVKQVFFGEQGEVFRSEADAQQAAERGTEQIRGVYTFMEIFAGSIAILMIVISGVRMVLSGGNEETMTKSKKQIMWAAIGLVLIGISELVVKDIVFPQQGATLSNVGRANELIVNITNFVSGFVATVAIGFYMYGGFLYVTAAGREDQAGKAKKVFIGATIGLLIALGAFAIVNTFVTLETGIEPLGGSASPSSLPTNP